MAKLIDYDKDSIRWVDEGYINLWAIGCIEGLLALPIVEIESTDKVIQILSYEKGFFGGKRLKGYVMLSTIDDYKIEISVPCGSYIYPNIDGAIGFEFKCDYASYNKEGVFYPFIGGDRKIILSKYYLMHYLNVKCGTHQSVYYDNSSTNDIEDLANRLQNMQQDKTLSNVRQMLLSLKFPI